MNINSTFTKTHTQAYNYIHMHICTFVIYFYLKHYFILYLFLENKNYILYRFSKTIQDITIFKSVESKGFLWHKSTFLNKTLHVLLYVFMRRTTLNVQYKHLQFLNVSCIYIFICMCIFVCVCVSMYWFVYSNVRKRQSCKICKLWHKWNFMYHNKNEIDKKETLNTIVTCKS